MPTLPRRPQLRGAQRRRDLGVDAVGGVRGAAEGARLARVLRRRPAAHGRLRRGGTQDGAARRDLHRAARRDPRRGRRRRGDDDDDDHGRRPRHEATRRHDDRRAGRRPTCWCSPWRSRAAARAPAPSRRRAIRSNFAGVVESFEVRPRIALGEVRIEEDNSCDRDGFIDAGERGRIAVPVMNGGPVEMRNTTVSITIADAPASPSSTAPRFASRGSRPSAAPRPSSRSRSTGRSPASASCSWTSPCRATRRASRPSTARSSRWINVDDVPGVSNSTRWRARRRRGRAAGADADEIWSRVEVTPFNHAWFGLDFGAVSDTTLDVARPARRHRRAVRDLVRSPVRIRDRMAARRRSSTAA